MPRPRKLWQFFRRKESRRTSLESFAFAPLFSPLHSSSKLGSALGLSKRFLPPSIQEPVECEVLFCFAFTERLVESSQLCEDTKNARRRKYIAVNFFPKLEEVTVSQNEAITNLARGLLADSPFANHEVSLDGMTATKGDASALTNAQMQKKNEKR